jgi:hypothetical protein
VAGGNVRRVGVAPTDLHVNARASAGAVAALAAGVGVIFLHTA